MEEKMKNCAEPGFWIGMDIAMITRRERKGSFNPARYCVFARDFIFYFLINDFTMVSALCHMLFLVLSQALPNSHSITTSTSLLLNAYCGRLV